MIDMINFYRVKDLEAVKHFYGDIMGFKLFKDQGKCLIYDMTYGKLGFCTHFPDEHTSSCITLVYESKTEVDEIYKRLLEASYIVEKPTINDYFKLYHFFVNDPNGLKIECQVFLD